MELLSSATHRIGAVPKTTVIVILGAYLASREVTWHALAGAGIASLLWLILYALNETYDKLLEEQRGLDGDHENKLEEHEGLDEIPLVEFILMFAGACVVANMLDQLSRRIMVLMVVSEMLYTHPWVRLKKYPWAGPVLSGVIGPTLRFGLGVHLGLKPTTNWTLIIGVYVMLLILHLPGALKSRVFRRVRDKGLGYYTLSARFVKHLRPLQFLTPVGVTALGILLSYAEQQKLFPPGTMATGLLLAVFLTTATWTMNDIHDYGGPGDIEYAVVILHDMWKLRFHTKRLRVTIGFAALLGFLFAISSPMAFIAVATGVYLTLDRAVGYRYT